MYLGEVVPFACGVAREACSRARKAQKNSYWPWERKPSWEDRKATTLSSADRLEEAARLLREFIVQVEEER
jgi:hypothetical protein